MYEDEEYGFCPECGALMKNGVCISCGYDRNKKATDTENTPSDPDKESDGFLSGETPNTGTETEDTPDMSSWEGQNTPDEQPSPDAQNTSDAVPKPAYGTPDTASGAQSAYAVVFPIFIGVLYPPKQKKPSFKQYTGLYYDIYQKADVRYSGTPGFMYPYRKYSS